MKKLINYFLIFVFLSINYAASMNAYDYTFKSINEVDDINLSDFKGKIIMVVNTASLCGFTYQYDGLQALHNKYSDAVSYTHLTLPTTYTV